MNMDRGTARNLEAALDHTLTYVLAGGKGERLMPLTSHRAKPAVPFGGPYRIFDGVASSMLHSHVRRVIVAMQYQYGSLKEHIEKGWRAYWPERGHSAFLETLLPMTGEGKEWFEGTAHPIVQDQDRLNREQPKYVMVLGADHIYRMDYRQFLLQHLDAAADLTVSAIPVPVDRARREFGVLVVDPEYRVTDFQEKPETPAEIPGAPGYCLASMGNYIFSRAALDDSLRIELGKTFARTREEKELRKADPTKWTALDFGGDVIPQMVRDGRAVYAYDFSKNVVPGQEPREQGYWRDVGTLQQYFDAQMDVLSVEPVFSLYNPEWPLIWQRPTGRSTLAPVKFPHADSIEDAIISLGSIVSRSRIRRSSLGWDCRVWDGSDINESLLLGNNEVGAGAKITRTIVDKRNRIPPGMEIGFDRAADESRGFKVVDNCKGPITIVPHKMFW